MSGGRFSLLEKAECAARELGFRRHVYAQRVAIGKMRQEQADREIALMQEIEEDYRAMHASLRGEVTANASTSDGGCGEDR